MYLIGVLWDTADFICTNPKCGKVLDGYGNYVTNLKKEVERLKVKYEPETPNAQVVRRGAGRRSVRTNGGLDDDV